MQLPSCVPLGILRRKQLQPWWQQRMWLRRTGQPRMERCGRHPVRSNQSLKQALRSPTGAARHSGRAARAQSRLPCLKAAWRVQISRLISREAWSSQMRPLRQQISGLMRLCARLPAQPQWQLVVRRCQATLKTMAPRSPPSQAPCPHTTCAPGVATRRELGVASCGMTHHIWAWQWAGHLMPAAFQVWQPGAWPAVTARCAQGMAAWRLCKRQGLRQQWLAAVPWQASTCCCQAMMAWGWASPPVCPSSQPAGLQHSSRQSVCRLRRCSMRSICCAKR